MHSMSSETVGIALSAATLVVIAATAAAAIVQLRHLRTSNQLDGLLTILDQWNSPTLRAAYSRFMRDIPAKLADPEYVSALESPGSKDRGVHPEFLVYDFWEQVGSYVKHGLINEGPLLDICSAQVSNAWRRAWPEMVILRKNAGPTAFENFEFLAVRAVLYLDRKPDGYYPSNLPRWADFIKSKNPAPPARPVAPGSETYVGSAGDGAPI